MIDPEPDYDGPDLEPDYDAGDIPADACVCHDSAPCPDLWAALAEERDPIPYRGDGEAWP